MDDEIRRIRSEEAVADSVYARFPEQSLSETPTVELCSNGPSCSEFDCPICSYEQ